jgi:transposase
MSELDPFKDCVRYRMAKGVHNTNKLYTEIKSRGYSGDKSILKSYVKPFRPLAKPSAVVRFDTLPGGQAQVDFGTLAYEDGLGKHRIYAFVMILSWSRAMYVEFVEECDLVTLL